MPQNWHVEELEVEFHISSGRWSRVSVKAENMRNGLRVVGAPQELLLS